MLSHVLTATFFWRRRAFFRRVGTSAEVLCSFSFVCWCRENIISSQMFCNIYWPLFTSSPPPFSIHIAQKFSSSHYFFCQVIFHLSACLPRAKFCFFCGSGIVGFCVNPKDPLPVSIKKAVGWTVVYFWTWHIRLSVDTNKRRSKMRPEIKEKQQSHTIELPSVILLLQHSAIIRYNCKWAIIRL